MGSDEERFWSKVDKSGDCWIWTDRPTVAGYGVFNIGGRRENGGRSVYAHRFAYEFLVGPIPEGYTIDHRYTCPKICVNPDHLRPATSKQQNENKAGAYRTSKSGVRGVCWDKNQKKWLATVGHNNDQIYVGRFSCLAEAEAAVIAKRLELFTHNDADRERGTL